ncbi:hypothetical protein RND81_08G195300 [Saponaria officinalis]|uniref:Uncharacterized protein n=1 Tax=Saponaria officinalis TaxID=3572 RepID=A0AAW1J9K8_SAPOF
MCTRRSSSSLVRIITHLVLIICSIFMTTQGRVLQPTPQKKDVYNVFSKEITYRDERIVWPNPKGDQPPPSGPSPKGNHPRPSGPNRGLFGSPAPPPRSIISNPKGDHPPSSGPSRGLFGSPPPAPPPRSIIS